MIVAVSQDIWLNYPGANYWDPNGNPICNKKMQLSYGGKSVVVSVRDYCPGCSAWQLGKMLPASQVEPSEAYSHSLRADLSPAVFTALTPSLDTGIMVGATWTWLS